MMPIAIAAAVSVVVFAAGFFAGMYSLKMRVMRRIGRSGHRFGNNDLYYLDDDDDGSIGDFDPEHCVADDDDRISLPEKY